MNNFFTGTASCRSEFCTCFAHFFLPTDISMSLDITGAGRQPALFIYRHRCDVDNF